MSPSNIVDRLNVIPWRHGTHEVWDRTTITSLRKLEVEEEVEEKVEVEVEVCVCVCLILGGVRGGGRGGDKGGT